MSATPSISPTATNPRIRVLCQLAGASYMAECQHLRCAAILAAEWDAAFGVRDHPKAAR